MPIIEEKMKTLPEIERILRDQKPILREKFKVREIGIFGSVVRGEQKETSDLDLLVEFEEPIGLIKYGRVRILLNRHSEIH
jgi:predicted nucleotidyltransferase